MGPAPVSPSLEGWRRSGVRKGDGESPEQAMLPLQGSRSGPRGVSGYARTPAHANRRRPGTRSFSHGPRQHHALPRRPAHRARARSSSRTRTASRSRPAARRSRCAAAASRACGRSATARTRSCASARRAPPSPAASRRRRRRARQRSRAAAERLRPRAARTAGRAASCSPRSHAPSRWRAKRASSSTSVAAPHRMSCVEQRLLAREAAREIDGGDRLVDRVGHDVLVEERRRALAAAQPAQAARVAAVGHRGLHLEEREVADDRPAPAAVQAEQRHEVDGRERHARQQVDVGAVARVQAERLHRVGEELGVDALGDAAAVLVGLDLHHRGLRRAVHPRQRPGVRVGLLELVGGAVRDELEHLLERRVALDDSATATAPRRRRRPRAARGPSRSGESRRRRDAARRRAAPPRSTTRGRGAAPAGSAPTPTRRRRPAGRGSAARSRGTARAGGPRRTAGRRGGSTSGASSGWTGCASAASRCSVISPRGSGSASTHAAVPRGACAACPAPRATR